MATGRAYLELGGGLVASIFLVIIGVMLFVKHRMSTRLAFVGAGSFFLGYLSFSLGLVSIIYLGPSNPVAAVQALMGVAAGCVLIGAVMGLLLPSAGEFLIGLACGWSAWTLVAGLIPSDSANLIVGIFLSLCGGIASKTQPKLVNDLFISWLASSFVTIGTTNLIISSLFINNTPWDIIAIVSFVTYIVSIILTFIILAIHIKRNRMVEMDRGIKNTNTRVSMVRESESEYRV